MLTEFPKDCDRRPIVLIGHCYGGLVMQQAYLTSHRLASDYPGIYNSITGMIFLGTPFQGSCLSNMGTGGENTGTVGEIYQVIRQQNLKIEDGLLQTIAHDNTILVDTVADFTREIQKRTAPPGLFCFFERRSTPIGKIANLKDRPMEFAVNESSGTLPGYGKLGLALDHFNMNKFGSNKDNHYISIIEELLHLTENTKDIMRKRAEALRAFPFIGPSKSSYANFLM